MAAPRGDLILSYPESYVSNSVSAMKRNYSAVHCNLLAFSLGRIEHQENALLGTKGQQPPRLREDFRQAEHLTVKVLRFVQIIDVNRRFQHTAQKGNRTRQIGSHAT